MSRGHLPMIVSVLAMLALQRTAMAEGKMTLEQVVKKADREMLMLEFGSAAEWYTKAIEMDPKSSRMYERRAECNDRLNREPEAIADYTKAIKLEPTSIYYRERGKAHWKAKHPKEAIADMTMSIKLEPNGSVSYRHRGNYYKLTGQYQKAIDDCLKNTSRYDKKPIMGWTNLGYCYEKLGQTDKALETYTKMVRKFPDLSQGYYGRARVYEKMGKLDLARKEKERGRKADGDYDPNVLTGDLRRD